MAKTTKERMDRETADTSSSKFDRGGGKIRTKGNAINKRSKTMMLRSFISIFEVSFVFILLGSVLSWRSHVTGGGSSISGSSSSSRRCLADTIAADMNDDITRDNVCKEYLKNFLNGTTDAADECQGMYNAYQAGDCADDGNKHSILGYALSDNNETDDNVLIDDFYENWECCGTISEYYSKHCEQSRLDSDRLLGTVIVMVTCFFMQTLIRKYEVQWIPDAAACILVGAAAGLFFRIVNPEYVTAQFMTFNNDLFLHILLPPIIFEAALTIDKRSFKKHIFPILSFAIFGTVISAFIVGLTTYYMSSLSFRQDRTQIPLLDSFVFGTLISSIDPVATLGILSTVGVSQVDTLYILIFGESLLNDGVAIVLFDTLVKHLKDVKTKTTTSDSNYYTANNNTADGTSFTYKEDAVTMDEIVQNFLLISAGSIGIGLVCGLVCAFYFYYLRGKHSPVTEVAIFFTWALIPFYLSDIFGCSGIISIMVMGICLDYFVIGGFQNEEREWIDYIALRCNQDSSNNLQQQPQQQQNPGGGRYGWLGGGGNNNPNNVTISNSNYRYEKLYTCFYVAFSGRGHLSNKSGHHVAFVAEVISTIMENAIFAYLGVFLFNDINMWNLRLNSISIFGCILSRAIMVIIISALINFFVWLDLENRIFKRIRRCFKHINTTTPANNHNFTTPSISISNNNMNGLGSPLLDSNNYLNNNASMSHDDDDDDDDDDVSAASKVYLDRKTQLILLLAGVRGAVSFALVCNIPVFDAVTKQGSHFKPELKAMVSSSIFFTIFVFGALTYFTVHQETDFHFDRRRIIGSLTHRLSPFASGNNSDNNDDNDSGFASVVDDDEDNITNNDDHHRHHFYHHVQNNNASSPNDNRLFLPGSSFLEIETEGNGATPITNNPLAATASSPNRAVNNNVSNRESLNIRSHRRSVSQTEDI